MSYDITNKYTAEFLRDMTIEQLQKLLTSIQFKFLELREQTSPHGRVKYVPKPHLFGKIKKDIARTKTIIGEKK